MPATTGVVIDAPPAWSLAAGSVDPCLFNSQLAIDLYRVSPDENELRELERIEPIQT
jgi:hypothetical protein